MKQQHRAEETRLDILDPTGVAEICRRAGLSKGAFYHHFPTKQAPFMALLAGLDARLAAARGGTLTSPEAFPRGPTCAALPIAYTINCNQLQQEGCGVL